MVNNQIGHLKQWMNESNIGTEELASSLGYKMLYIEYILRGYQPLTDKLIGAFTRVYGLDAAAAAFGLEYEGAAK